MITLREITMENFRECIRLTVNGDQKKFVAGNTYSLAEAKADGVSNPRAVYSNDQMVGFIMYDFEPKEDRGYISRLMIDARFQGKGYGRAAMEQVIDLFRQLPECRSIQTSYVPANTAAGRLYRSLGLEETGEIEDGELVVRLNLFPEVDQ